MNWLRNIWQDIIRGEKLDLYVTILGALILVILATFGFDVQPYVFPAVLAFLALNALNMIVIRNRQEEILLVMKEGHSILVKEYPEDLFLKIAEAKELWLIGVSMCDLLEKLYPIIEEKLSRNHQIRVLLVHPNDKFIEITSNRDVKVDVSYERSRVMRSLTCLSELKLKADRKDRLQIRVTRNPIDFETIMIDDHSNKLLYMRHYGFKTQLGTEPVLVLNSYTNPNWAGYFYTHIQNLWNFSEDWPEQH